MLRKLPVVTETPFIPSTPGQAAYTWCPPPTPPPPPAPPPRPPGIYRVCWRDSQGWMRCMYEVVGPTPEGKWVDVTV